MPLELLDAYKLKWTNDLSVNYNLVKRKSLKAKFVYLCKDLMPKFLTSKKFRFKDINASLASSGEVTENDLIGKQ